SYDVRSPASTRKRSFSTATPHPNPHANCWTAIAAPATNCLRSPGGRQSVKVKQRMQRYAPLSNRGKNCSERTSSLHIVLTRQVRRFAGAAGRFLDSSCSLHFAIGSI